METMESAPEASANSTDDLCIKPDEPMEQTAETPAGSNDEAFAYLHTDRFTSEKFKIEVRGLPKYYGIGEFRKLLNEKLGLNCCKIKPPKRKGAWIYLNFRSEDDREKAIGILNGFSWKNSKLTAHTASAVPDPYFKKRTAEQLEKQKLNMNISADEILKNSTVPLWNMPYDQQLLTKTNNIKKILGDLTYQLIRDNRHTKLVNLLEERSKQNGGIICELSDIRHVPVDQFSKGYRNKCEFSIGMNEASGTKTIGFRYGAYVEGSTSIGPVDDLPHVPERMKEVVKIFEQFVRKSKLDVFSPVYVKGFWKQLTIRLGMNTGEIMVIVGGNANNITDDQLTQTKKEIVSFFAEEEGKACNLTSLYFHNISTSERNHDNKSLELLSGAATITEVVNGLKFSISPFSFFQIHTAAAEILFNSVAELIPPSKNVTLLDICCGTGTIGLCLSKKCDQVLGIESEPAAIVNADLNCKQNNVENCSFHLGKAEEILPTIIQLAKHDEIIAVVDPPRAGLHKKALLQLRRTSNINKLIYLSCNPKAALANFVDFGRRPTKTFVGSQFIPTRAIPVDNFPHTSHCELILVFERYDEKMLAGQAEPITSQTFEPTNGEKMQECKEEPSSSNNLESISTSSISNNNENVIQESTTIKSDSI